MMAFTEARYDFTYSKMRGIVSILAGFIKERKLGWNELIQKLILTSGLYPRSYFRTYLKIHENHNKETEGGFKVNSPSLAEDSQVRPCDFDYLKVIGKGSFGKVLLARHKETSHYYAVKVLQKRIVLKKKEQKHIMAERSVLLKNLQHPFLVGLHYSFQTFDKLYFVLDYANGGELFCHLQRERVFLEPRARFYAAEIAGALGYLHSIHIIYRDLKPENILLDSQGHIMLTDFGLCKESLEHDDVTFTFCGTPEYLAPEVLQKQAYDRTVDWWCLGAVLYEMLYGLPPFYSSNTDEMYNNILNKDPVLKPNVSNAGRALLEALLHKDRTQRMGARNDFMEVRSHAFFSPINWDDLMAKKTQPPFVPPLAGPTDLRHFDPEFTHLPVPGSLCNPDSSTVTSSMREAAGAFPGFSYGSSIDQALD
ncbi:serine/threonine-protein kinase Sgk1-like isoform X2 [Brienomyrus brachyistius]|uniref:serine/threonine-protein kinase Sgk1-like isoform X2 n=1 Tax=Brienomyrus brachyistius TaxID=42636 RepID=UPI0020B45936|nr:serine/threonine-protein kinase Sgk1-like isoform X2 [Brienomyrus brachyistius]